MKNILNHRIIPKVDIVSDIQVLGMVENTPYGIVSVDLRHPGPPDEMKAFFCRFSFKFGYNVKWYFPQILAENTKGDKYDNLKQVFLEKNFKRFLFEEYKPQGNERIIRRASTLVEEDAKRYLRKEVRGIKFPKAVLVADPLATLKEVDFHWENIINYFFQKKGCYSLGNDIHKLFKANPEVERTWVVYR